ncbi:MAG: MFS transporter [Firmicutes bacterium]|nr:MFS transporter [Bacillota bacterium]
MPARGDTASSKGELAEHWPVLAVAFLVSLVAMGLRFATGPFMSPMAADFGFTQGQLSTIVAGSMLGFGLALPLAGRLADAWGSRAVAAAGLACLALSLATVARTASAAVFSAAFVIGASLGFAATSQVALSPLITRWFVRQRGLAMTFLSAGGMAGIALFTPVSAILIDAVGWRNAYLLFAVFIGVLLLPALLLLVRERPVPMQSASTRAAWKPALATGPFWLCAAGMFACGFSMNLMSTHGVPMLEHHGFPTMTASLGIGLLGLVSVGGTLSLGALSDRLGRPAFLALIYFVRALGFVALVFAGREWELYLTAAIGGLVWAGSPALTSAITADLYGPRVVGTLFGLMYMGHQVGAAAGAFLGGWAFDASGDYTGAFVTAAVLLVAGAAASRRIPAMAPAVTAEGGVAG